MFRSSLLHVHLRAPEPWPGLSQPSDPRAATPAVAAAHRRPRLGQHPPSASFPRWIDALRAPHPSRRSHPPWRPCHEQSWAQVGPTKRGWRSVRRVETYVFLSLFVLWRFQVPSAVLAVWVACGGDAGILLYKKNTDIN